MKKRLFLVMLAALLIVAAPVFAAMTVSDSGADDILSKYFNGASSPDLILKLYCTSMGTLQTYTYSSFTECTGGGYASKTLTHGNWTLTPANDPSDVLYTGQTWTFTGPLTTNQTIYGYFVLSTSGTGTLLFHEALSSSFTPSANGDTLTITPRFQASTGTPQ